MFIEVNRLSYQVPSFNYEDPSSWDRYQKRMKEDLFSLSREKDPLKIDRDVENWLSIARNGSFSQCMSMYSVISYFFPNKIHESYFKSRIEYFHNTLLRIIETKVREEQSPLNKSKQTKNSMSSTPVEVNTPKAPKAKKTSSPEEDRNFETEFPTFSEGGFPDSDSDIFDKLLKEENKVTGDDNKKK